jgi:hypothetical protein
MPKIVIERETGLNATEAYTKIKSMLADDKDLRKFDAGYQCQFDDAQLVGAAKGKQFSADLKVDGTPTKVALTVDLPIMLTPFKGMVENLLKTKLEKILA